MIIVYQHRRLDTKEIFYIGIGNNIKRAYNKNNNRNNYWKNIINKTNYSVEILHDNLTWKEACIIEKLLISYYGRKDLGLGLLVNMTDGGDGCIGNIITQEHKDKISKALKGKFRTIECKKNISNGRLGIQFSEEHKQNLSEKRKLMFKNGYKSSVSREVIDLSTDIVYNSLKEACLKLNLKYTTTRAQITGQNPNKTTLKYNQ